MKKLNIVVVIVSDTRTDDTDKSGKKLKHLIENDGHVVLDKTIVKDNIYEIRKVVSDNIKTSSLQSRAIAGVANKTFIFVLPGSMDACITAWQDIITHQLNSDTKPCNLVMLMPRLNE